MSHSNALGLWPVEVDEQVRAACEPIYDSFACARHYVQEMWVKAAEAQGALNYYNAAIDLAPVIQFLQFIQGKLFDRGFEVASVAQQAVYDAWWEREPIVRQQRRSLIGLAAARHDPEVAHVP